MNPVVRSADCSKCKWTKHYCKFCYSEILTLCLLLSSANNLCKQFGPRSGSILFDTLMVFMKEFFKKVDFEKNHKKTKKHEKLPSKQRVNRFKINNCPNIYMYEYIFSSNAYPTHKYPQY